MKSIALISAVALLLTSACSVGSITNKVATKQIGPSVFRSNDLDLACMAGGALTPVLGGVGDEDSHPEMALLISRIGAALCAEAQTWDASLDRELALHRGDHVALLDASEVELRVHVKAARRFLQVWNTLPNAFPDHTPGEGCPQFSANEVIGQTEQGIYLVGLAGGLLATLHDIAAGGYLGVSLTTPREVERAATCLDNEAWWGAPEALRAAVWSVVPGSGPEGVDPIMTISTSATTGEDAGVNLSRALQIQVLSSLGREDDLWNAMSAASHYRSNANRHPDWLLLDSFAAAMIDFESDRRWIAVKGHRTPLTSFGTSPHVNKVETSNDELDDLLMDFLNEESPTEPPPEEQ